MRKLAIAIPSLLSAFAILVGCESNTDSEPSSSVAARSYQAAGSRWELSTTDTTFSLNEYANLSDTTSDGTITGTVTQNSTNLFKTLTITAKSGTNQNDYPAVGSSVYALEIPNSLAFIQPPDSSDVPLVATVIGSCPLADFTSNWVHTKPTLSGTFDPAVFDSDGAGTAFFNFGGGSPDQFEVVQSGILDGIAGTPSSDNNLTMSNCSNGRLAANVFSEDFELYFTASGQIVVKFPPAMGNQIISGLPQTSAAVTASTVNGVYSVFVYEASGATLSISSLTPARLTLNDAGTNELVEIATVSSNTEGSQLLTLNGFKNQDDAGSPANLPNGFFRYTINSAGGGKITCATSDVSPRPIICYGYRNSGASRTPVSIVGYKR